MIPLTLVTLAVIATACAKKSEANTPADSKAGPAPDSASGITGKLGDPDRAMQGSGVPTGYMAVTDKPDASIAGAKYTENAGKWEVQTGPAHIVYAAKDTASGIYAVSATIEQLEKPRHPEAYGVFFGGQHLDDRAQQTYGYFLVRGTGEFLVKVRTGAKTSTVVDWKADANIPKEDASGRATYALKVHFAKDTAHFLVNDKLVDAIPRAKLPTDGIGGLRINHNLHVSVTPATIEK